MKTRVYQISHLIISLSLCLAAQSCNKEDFYQKEFLDNPFQENPVTPDTTGSTQGGNNGSFQGGNSGGSATGGTTGSTTGSSTGGSTSGSSTSGSTSGGVDGSTTSGSTTGGQTTGGQATGGTTGNTDGSVTGGSSTGSSTGGVNGTTTSGTTTGGSATGGVNGSTTSGSTTGSVTGGTTGGSTTGSVTGGTTGGSTTGSVTGGTTGGSTTGSVTGGTSGGSTTGGSTTGSSRGGSSTGGTTGTTYGDCNNGHGNDPDRIDESNPRIGLEPKCTREKFKQNAKQTKNLDILWVIDNSGSMADEQQALGANFSAFIDDFITKDVNFKMAITTTDTSSVQLKGLMVPGSDVKLTSARAKANENQFKSDFRNLVKVGISGSGYEKGLEASEGFMEKYAASFLRKDAYLAVVVVSDENDQSFRTVTAYTDYLKSFKSEAGLVKVYTIADINKTNSGYGITTGADRYIKASMETGGNIADIRDDFYRSLSDMGESIINLLDSFALGHTPVPGTLKVYINNVETMDYTYDEASRSIKFDAGRLPPVGADIAVYYIKQ